MALLINGMIYVSRILLRRTRRVGAKTQKIDSLLC